MYNTIQLKRGLLANRTTITPAEVIAEFTKAVVANCAVLVPTVAVGAVGVPVKAGDAKGAFDAKAFVIVVA